jgi:serine/threonine protein kinase
MTFSHIQKALALRNNQLINFTTDEKKTALGAGSFSHVYLNYLPGIDLSRNDEKKPEPFICSMLKTSIDEKAYQVQHLLHDTQMPMDFITDYFYVSETGIKVTALAYGDLKKFIHDYSRKLTFDQFVQFAGSLILSLNDLHSRHIVHRELKPENILVFANGGSFFIKIADLDTMVAVTNKGLPKTFVSTPGYEKHVAPDIRAMMKIKSLELIMKGKGDKINSEVNIAYNRFDLCKADRFSLGMLLNDLADVCHEWEKLPVQKNKFVTLINELRDKRVSLKHVMGNVVFGKTPVERQNFFNRLRENAKKLQFFIDGKRVTKRKPGDPYWLLDRSIKPIYFEIAQVADHIEKCMQPGVKNAASLAHVITTLKQAEKTLLSLQETPLPFALEFKKAIEDDVLAIQRMVPDDHRLIQCVLNDVINECERIYILPHNGFFQKVPPHLAEEITRLKRLATDFMNAVLTKGNPLGLIQAYLTSKDVSIVDHTAKSLIQEIFWKLPEEIRLRIFPNFHDDEIKTIRI